MSTTIINGTVFQPTDTIGAWKVTPDEYKTASDIVRVDDHPLCDAAYQLVRYCRGEIFQRDPAAEALRAIRAGATS